MQSRRTKRRKTKLDMVCIVLAWALIVGGGGFIAYKLWGYWRSESRYTALRDAYAPTAAVQTAADPQKEAVPAVDFAALREKCPGAVAWLEVEDIGLSYPVVQAKDNTYYLHHAADGTADAAGSIFLDAVNTGFEDPHVLIYGHHMQDGSMFGLLYDYREKAFYDKGTHGFTLYTPEGTRRYEIFSVQVVDENDPVFTLGFTAGSAFDAFAQSLCTASLYDTGVSVSGEDSILSLSTCATPAGVGRLVVSGKLVSVA